MFETFYQCLKMATFVKRKKHDSGIENFTTQSQGVSAAPLDICIEGEWVGSGRGDWGSEKLMCKTFPEGGYKLTSRFQCCVFSCPKTDI